MDNTNRRIEDDNEDDILDTTRPKSNFFSKMSNISSNKKIKSTENDISNTSSLKNDSNNNTSTVETGGFFSKFAGGVKTDIGFNLFKNEDSNTSQMKVSNKIKVGYYRLSSENKVCKYVYVPSSLAMSSNFNIDDIFVALGIPTPNLMFEMNVATDVDTWNVRLPTYKSSLVGAKHPNPEQNQYNGSLRH